MARNEAISARANQRTGILFQWALPLIGAAGLPVHTTQALITGRYPNVIKLRDDSGNERAPLTHPVVAQPLDRPLFRYAIKRAKKEKSLNLTTLAGIPMSLS